MIARLDENNAIYVQESEFKLLTKGRAHLTGNNSDNDKKLIEPLDRGLAADEDLAYSRRQPAWHVFVLSVFSFAIYNLYWFYKNLKFLHELPPIETNFPAVTAEAAAGGASASTVAGTAADAVAKDSPIYVCQKHPVFSTFLFFIPIVNLIIGMQFFALVGQLLPDKESLWRKHSFLCAFALALAYGALFLFSFLPAPYFLFYLLSALPLAFVQTGLNKYWKVIEQDKLIVRAAFNPIELVCIFFGAGLLGLDAVGPSIIPTLKP